MLGEDTGQKRPVTSITALSDMKKENNGVEQQVGPLTIIVVKVPLATMIHKGSVGSEVVVTSVVKGVNHTVLIISFRVIQAIRVRFWVIYMSVLSSFLGRGATGE
jgi:hypothetical protein